MSQNIKNEIIEIGKSLVLSNKMLLQATINCNRDKFVQIKLELKQIITELTGIDNSIIKILTLRTSQSKNIRYLIPYLKITNDLVCASESTRKFTTVCDNLDMTTINKYAIPMQEATIKALELSLSMLSIDDVDELYEIYDSVVIEESKSDEIYEFIESNLLSQDKNNTHTYHKMLKLLRKNTKIASYSISIANLVLYAKTGGNFHN